MYYKTITMLSSSPRKTTATAIPGILAAVLLALMSTAVGKVAGECSWTRRSSPPAGLRWMESAATKLDDKYSTIVFAGGTSMDFESGKPTGDRANVTAYSAALDVWKTWKPMPTARSAPGAGVVNGRLYVFGGSQKIPHPNNTAYTTRPLDVVESISLEGGDWRVETSLPSPRESPGVVSLPNNTGIVIAGGFHSEVDGEGVLHFGYFNDSYLFLGGKQYIRLPDMPFARSNMDLVAANGGVYAIGGGKTDPSYDTCAYLPLANISTAHISPPSKWGACPTLLQPRSWAAAGALSGQIVLAGGMSGTFSPLASVDILGLSPASDAWKSAGCDLPFASGFLSGDSVDDKTFVLYSGAAPFPEANAAMVLQFS